MTPSAIEATARFCSSTVTATVQEIVEISSMMPLTCSIACAASATADWIAPTWLAISSVALGGLAGQRFHLGSDHRETAAGRARARRLDGGVERKEIGLSGDRLDQPHHFADAGGGFAQLRHGAHGTPRLP